METSVIDDNFALPLTLDLPDIQPKLFSITTNPFYVGYLDSAGRISNVKTSASLPDVSRFRRSSSSTYSVYWSDNTTLAFTLQSDTVNDGEYLVLMDRNAVNASPPDITVDWLIMDVGRNVSSLSMLFKNQCAFVLANSTQRYRWSFQNAEVYYIDRDGNEVLLYSGSTDVIGASDLYLFTQQIDVDVYSYVSSIHFRYTNISRQSSASYVYGGSVASASFYYQLYFNSYSTEHIDVSYAPSDEDIPLLIWSQLLDILSYLQNPMQVTLQSILQAIKDGGSATSAATVIIQQINSTVTNIANTVNNVLQALTPAPTQEDDANVFESSIGGLSDAVESDASALESLSPRPSPSDVISTISPDILNPSNPDVKEGISIFSDIMSSPMVLPILLTVFTLATIRFVLFGKR